MPQRYQRSRRSGARLPEGTVCVDRSNKRYGNPFIIGGPIAVSATPVGFVRTIAGVTWRNRPLARSGRGIVVDRQHAVDLFEFWIYLAVPFTEAQLVADLGGKNLACYCPVGQPCHADLLLSMAGGAQP